MPIKNKVRVKLQDSFSKETSKIIQKEIIEKLEWKTALFKEKKVELILKAKPSGLHREEKKVNVEYKYQITNIEPYPFILEGSTRCLVEFQDKYENYDNLIYDKSLSRGVKDILDKLYQIEQKVNRRYIANRNRKKKLKKE